MTIKEVNALFNVSADTLRYYERVGMIPPVTRSASGNRDYQEIDLRWVDLAICLRSAGLPVEILIDYVRLYQQGDDTIPARLQLLKEQREALIKQKNQIEATLKRLDTKIEGYEIAIEPGEYPWHVKGGNEND